MQPDAEADEIIAEYAAGQDADGIARRYGMTRDEVEYLVAGGEQVQPERPSWLESEGNRVLLGIGVGWVAWFIAGLLGAEASLRIVLLLVPVNTYGVVKYAHRALWSIRSSR